MIGLKLPIGLDLLVALGIFTFFTRRLPRESQVGFSIVLTAVVVFLLVLSRGSTYAGVRHALPAVALLALCAGAALNAAFLSHSKLFKVAVGVALVAAAVSAIPVLRPWEYFNEIIGTKNGYLYFSDDGVDVGQRGKELAAYYRRVLEPSGEVPLYEYGNGTNESELNARHVDWIGRDPARDQNQLSSSIFQGTLLVNAKFLSKQPFWDNASLRSTTPTTRFGNLLVFRGACACGALLAPGLYFDAESKIYAEKPDLHKAEQLLRQSIALDPSAFFAHIELGNLVLKRGAREDALRAYSEALQHAPSDPVLRRPIEEQIKRVSSEPLDHIPGLRNPFLE